MPDAKITALTAISVIDVAADVLPIVDISDTSMAASGTTKKITINQILGASGTATFSVLTVSGAATAQRFIPSSATVPTNGMYLPAANELGWAINSAEAMRLNANGLGLGVVPSAWNNTYNVLDIGQNGSISGRTSTNNTVDIVSNGFRNSGGTWVYKLAASSAAARYQIDGSSGSHLWYNAVAGTTGNTIAGFSTPIMTLDVNGNLILLPSNTPATLATNGQLTVNATSNTNLRFSYRGSDGTTRVANITLA